MRLVISRKGFDSTAGGCASPILPDGTMVSLPIPDEESGVRYGDIAVHGHDVGALVADLSGGRYGRRARAHLDPDLVPDAMPRAAGPAECGDSAASVQTGGFSAQPLGGMVSPPVGPGPVR